MKIHMITISITEILNAMTTWIRMSGLAQNYVPKLLAWIGTGGIVAFVICALLVEGVARKIAKIIVTVFTVLIILTFLQEAQMLPELPIIFTW